MAHPGEIRTPCSTRRSCVRRCATRFLKLDPRRELRNPVMFTVYVGSILTSGLYVQSLFGAGRGPAAVHLWISVWLWFTVLFANFAEAMAEGRGKAQADALRRARHEVPAKKLPSPFGRVVQGPPALRAGEPRRPSPPTPLPPAGEGRSRSSPPPTSAPATWSSSRPATMFPPTAK